MLKRAKQLLAALLCLSGCAPQPRNDEINHWAIYYNDELPAADFKDLDMVVFDRRSYPKFDTLDKKTKVLAYVSIGEVYDDVPEKRLLEKKNLLLYKGDVWGSHAVDITALTWQKLVLGYVDDAARKGFDGVMLDTIDSPLYWAETKEPERLSAMEDAAVELIKAIREAHPEMKIMVNRGFKILPRVADDINYVLAESIMANTDVSTGQFALFSPNTYDQAAIQLHHVVALAPHLQVFTLDYWNQDDVKGLERIYAAQRAEGFTPYVTTPDLKRFTPEPHASPHRKT